MSRVVPSRAVPLVVAVVVALAGCAGIPTSGPVKAGGDLRLERADEGVPVIGEPPRPGASPGEIVSGFLDSSADFQNDHEVARLYLTSAASQAWRPQSGTVIYDKSASTLDPPQGEAATITFEAPEVGQIAADGAYSRAVPGATVTRRFELTRTGGEWRISAVGNGLLLSSSELGDTYRQVSLYFLAPTGDALVPDTVLIPELPGLSTKLVARLLRGPTASMRGAVTTAFPEGTSLDVGSVPVTDGVALVGLDSTALGVDDTTRQQMSAQLVWTLKQLAGVRAIRITAGGESLRVTSAGAEQQRDDWPTFDPDRVPGNLSAYVELNGRIGRYLGGKFVPVLGAGGAGGPQAPQLRAPAVTLDNTRLAALTTDGSTVLVGQMTNDAALEPRIQGADFSAPSWDRDKGLWVVDRASGQLLFLADGAEKAQQVTVPSAGGRLQAVQVSRDGARVALVVGTGRGARMRIGSIRRLAGTDSGDERLSLQSLTQPLPELRGVRDVTWADATHVMVVGSLDEGVLRPYQVSIDGWKFPDVEPVPGTSPAVSISAAPPLGENPLVVGTADGHLWEFASSSGWAELGPGSSPAYPG